MRRGGIDEATYGDWRVQAILGAGGMGVVYDAIDQHGRRAALKVITPALADDPMFRTRFRREIEVTLRVSGDRTAAVLDADPDSSPPWLATEFVDGPTLGEAIEADGPLTGEALTSLAAALLQALQEIHDAGVVHRDLKPSNVILTAATPKVIDFGIAASAEATALTATGAFIGSAGWMSPEQVQGGDVGPATDVFAWGALIAYTATGRRPFGDGRPEALAYRVVHTPPAIEAVPANLKPSVAAALAVDPATRPTVSDLLSRLADGHDATGVIERGWDTISPTRVQARNRTAVGTALHQPALSPAIELSTPRRRWWYPAAVAAVILVAVGATAYALNLGPDSDVLADKPASTSEDPTSSTTTVATTTTTSSTTTTSAPTTTAGPSFAGEDWLNKAYDLSCSGETQRYQLLDGQSSSPDPADPSVRFGEIWTGNYDDHPGDEAVVTLACAFGASTVIDHLLVYEPTDAGPRRVGSGISISDGFFALEGDTFVQYEPEYSPGDPACCPSFYERREVTVDTRQSEGAYPSAQATVVHTSDVPFPDQDF